MDFLKRHYEKLLLLFMLVLFIGIMFYVVDVADQARKYGSSDLKVRESALKHMVEVQKTEDTGKIIGEARSDWKTSTQRVIFDTESKRPVSGTYSDLVIAPAISACFFCKDLIPRFYYKDKFKCPSCAHELATPDPAAQRLRASTEDDWDGDGMPNSFETSKGFNPQDYTDQLEDADRDGFSNLFEYENDTDPKDPKHRMPLWYRLRYIAMESIVLPIVFKRVTDERNPKDKKMWDLQFEFPIFKNGKKVDERNPIHRLGEQIFIEKVPYRITSISDDKKFVTLEQVLDKDAGSRKKDVLVLEIGKEVRSNDKSLFLEDMGTPATNPSGVGKKSGRRLFVVKKGGIVTIGDRRTGREKYRLMDVNEKSMTASFVRDGVADGDPSKDIHGKKILVTRDSEIPEELQVVASKTQPKTSAPGRRKK